MILSLLFSAPAQAEDSIIVMADNGLSVIVTEISRSYARDAGAIVNASYLSKEAHETQITDGGAADVLITTSLPWIESLKLQGLVDVYSLTPLTKKAKTQIYAIVIAGENMERARKFIEYLKTGTVQIILRNHDL